MVSLIIDYLSEVFQVDAYGIAHTKKTANISYPSTGNNLCFQLEDKSFWFKHRNNCIIEAIRRYPPKGEILDIGGGNGYVTRRLIDEGYPAVLLEPGISGAYNGKIGRNLPHVICSTLQDLDLQAASVASAGCFDVIEHIDDDAAFVKDVARILQPKGMLYLTLPAKEWLWSACDLYSGHFRRYDERSVANLLEKYFEILYFTFFFGCISLPLFIMKALPYRLGISKEKPNVWAHETEHGVNSGIVSLIERILDKETTNIRKGKSKAWGTSCLAVAMRKLEI